MHKFKSFQLFGWIIKFAGIFRNPRVFFTCPQGEDSPNDLLKTPARLHNGKWIIERDPIKIIARNQVVGRKRVYSFRYEEMEAGGRAWYLEVFRLNLIHSVAHCLMQNYKVFFFNLFSIY